VDADVAASWDAEYAAGRYASAAPVGFVTDVLAAARQHGLRRGLYIGCGNGRNLVPLVDAGLNLTGLDISPAAIAQLRQWRPGLGAKLITGDLGALPPSLRYELVIGIQVFQHGDRGVAHRHLTAAAARVAPGGLLCVRVNATDTGVEHAHRRLDEEDGGFTARYLAGPKAGLDIHFFTAAELRSVVGAGFGEVLAPRLDRTERTPPGRGHWSQWEAIWRRQPAVGPPVSRPDLTGPASRRPRSAWCR
jgi:hypothetical protein